MFKGVCFGSCLVYKLIIYEGGIVVYEGQCFINCIGLYIKLFDQNVYKDFIVVFDVFNFWGY